MCKCGSPGGEIACASVRMKCKIYGLTSISIKISVYNRNILPSPPIVRRRDGRLAVLKNEEWDRNASVQVKFAWRRIGVWKCENVGLASVKWIIHEIRNNNLKNEK